MSTNTPHNQRQVSIGIGSVTCQSVQVTPPQYRPLPESLAGHCHKFNVAGCSGHLICKNYPNGQLGFIYIDIDYDGTFMSDVTVVGLIRSFCEVVTCALQHGVPLESLVKLMIGKRFEPLGFTDNVNIRSAKSIIDYVFRWLKLHYAENPKGDATSVAE